MYVLCMYVVMCVCMYNELSKCKVHTHVHVPDIKKYMSTVTNSRSL